MQLPIYQVDAFTDRVLGGNPAAVCPLQAWLDDSTLQRIAEENNLSETAYFVKEGEGYRLRWFTPAVEVDLCGHATLASGHILLTRDAEGQALERITFRTRVGRQVTFGKQRYRLALELHVIDNGPGVPDSIKDRIFFPLVSGRDGGSGLGLTLAQTFVQQHHGLIECESTPGHTDFKILIPLP